jgi:hypothetical protein
LAYDEHEAQLLRLIAATLGVSEQAFGNEHAVDLDAVGDLHSTLLLGRLIRAFRSLPNDDKQLEALRMLEEFTPRHA